jgi:quercetin dioxygenase-like cupin family protein
MADMPARFFRGYEMGWVLANKQEKNMKKISLDQTNEFSQKTFKKFLLHDSPYFKVINFNIAAGQVFPVHSHKLEGQLTIQVISGEGEFLGKDDLAMPAVAGDILVSDISEPHGVRASKNVDLRILVTIAPPI